MELNIYSLVEEALDKAFEKLKSGDSVWAEEIYRQILKVDPSCNKARSMLAIACSKNKKHEEACSLASSCFNAEDFNNYALILSAAGRNSEAIDIFKKAISICPSPHLLSNLALEYKNIGNWSDSFSTFESSVKEFPDSDYLWFNYGAVVQESGNQELSSNLYEKAININPFLAAAHYNLSACYFLLGDYKKAWKEYEWRWQHFPHFLSLRNSLKGTFWTGENLKDKKILIYCEQGLGDFIQFYRYVKCLDCQVYIRCSPELRPLFKESDGEDYDYHCSILTVAGILGVEPSNIDGNPYLKSEPYMGMSRYENRIGICWSGNPQHPNDINRSRHLKHFSLPGTLFSLQKDYRARQYSNGSIIDYCEGMEKKVIDMSEHLTDLSITASVIEAMDYVVTVDTVIGHLSGALGKKCFIILPKNPDWRWLLSATDWTPWYNSVKLIRSHT